MSSSIYLGVRVGGGAYKGTHLQEQEQQRTSLTRDIVQYAMDVAHFSIMSNGNKIVHSYYGEHLKLIYTAKL